MTPDGALLDEKGQNLVFDVVFSCGTMSPAFLARRKVHGHHTMADRETAKRARDAVYRDTYSRQERGLDPAAGEKLRRAADAAVRDAYHPGYEVPCAMRGDQFFPVLLSIHGGWYPESSAFLKSMLHSGDTKRSLFVDHERFDHHSRTWASWKHGVFLKQAVACMAASGQYLALHKRAIQALAAESDGRAAGRSAGGAGAGVAPPSPRPHAA